MSLENPLFKIGDNVCYIGTGKIGTINKVIIGTRSISYKVTIDGQIKTIAERFLQRAIDSEESVLTTIAEQKYGNHTDFRLFQTWFRLKRPLEGSLYSYLGSKTIFNPHQFKPLLRFISPGSEERLFIADEVGVGKTIETGIILTELFSRGQLDSHTPILIICPYSIGPKWVSEMKKRFRLSFHLHDGKSLKYMLKTTINDGFVPQGYLYSVVGLQLMRMEENTQLLRELDAKKDSPVFNMVIIDEAHRMRNPETDSNELGNLLSSMTEKMIMLSATPLNLKNEDLFNQMHILNPVMYPDNTIFEALQSPVIVLNIIRSLITKQSPDIFHEIFKQLKELERGPLGKAVLAHPATIQFCERIKSDKPFSTEEVARYERLFVSLSPLFLSFTRTRKREALEHQVQREVWEVPVQFSREEMKFHNDVIEVIKKIYLARGGATNALGFVMNMPRRMVSSCIPAMREYLEWSIKENKIIMDESIDSEDPEDDSQLKIMELNPELKQIFVQLLERAEELEGNDSKYIQFRNLVKKIVSNPETPQVIVFSFFVRALKYLKRRLEKDGFTVGLIHGEVPLQGNKGLPGRYEIMESFEKGEFQILLSSEVGGEGLDFQYCHAIINYDLPYNPMVIEQRIGRIDRFGQEADKVIIGNIFIKETVDEEIYDRLYRRIKLVEDGIGALEPILGRELSNIQTAIITGSLSNEQKEVLSQRIERAIAEAKIQMEEFEQHSKELLGDDYLAKPINNLTKCEFISPMDAIELTTFYLKNWNGCEFQNTKENCGMITLTPEIIDRVERFLRTPGNEGGYGELQSLIKSKGPVKVVFDGSIADVNKDHAFLAPTGYWSKYLIQELENENAILKTFKFLLNASDVPLEQSEYFVFLYEIRIVGLKTDIEFWGIPVRIQDQTVIKTSFEHLPRLLASATHASNDFTIEDIDVNDLYNSAVVELEHLLEEKRTLLADENKYRVESRKAALKRSSDIKKKKLHDQIEKHRKRRQEENKLPDETYLRLTEARITKEDARLQSMILELEKHGNLTIDFNLEAAVYLKIDGKEE